MSRRFAEQFIRDHFVADDAKVTVSYVFDKYVEACKLAEIGMLASLFMSIREVYPNVHMGTVKCDGARVMAYCGLGPADPAPVEA